MGQQQQTVAASTLLRRIVLALAIAAVMALLMMALAAPAFAVSIHGTNADQVGKQASGVNQPDTPGSIPGRGGQVIRNEAQSDASDAGIGDFASTNHHTRL